jgi:hypothetical protein
MSQKAFVVTDHAAAEIRRRNISIVMIEETLQQPDQKTCAAKGRIIYQKRYYMTDLMKDMLLRVVVERVGENLRIITAYRTSKIDKYWRSETQDENNL